MSKGIKKRSVDIAGHRTSVSLEAPFWDVLAEIAARDQTSISQLIVAIDSARDGNLSSAIRIFVLRDVIARVQT